MALSTASKHTFNATPVSKLAEAADHHKSLVRELSVAKSSDAASEAVQKYAAVVYKARAGTPDAAWAKMVQDTRSALALNVQLDPADKKAAHAEITRLQQLQK